MRIAIISHNIVKQGSGQGKVTYELVRYLLEKGYFIDLYGEAVDADLIRHNKIKFFIIKIPQKPAIIRNILFIIIVNRKLKTIKLKRAKYYDIIHIDSGCTTTDFWDISTCHYCHNRSKEYEKGIYHRFCAIINSRLEKWMYKKLIVSESFRDNRMQSKKSIIAVSKRLKDDLQEYIGIDPKKINIIHNGVDLDEFNPENRDFFHQELLNLYFGSSLDRNSFIMLFVGDLIKRKGIDLLLNAMKQMQPNIKLLIVGQERLIYINKVVKYGMGNNIKFIGFQNNIAGIYKGSDVLIVPSLYDSFGNVVLEAMACGTPVIVSKFAGSSEIISEGINGLTFDTFEGLVEKMDLLYKNRDLYESIRINARRTAVKYSWTAMAMAVEKLYLAMLNQNR
ncbi:MAG: glycosyltransferase family 4 protein [bacterium]|nr:glycosyltransferase family 4 protein [bacterium]